MALQVDAELLAGLWDFDDPAGSEARFRTAAGEAGSPGREVLLTQVARTLGLQEQFEAAHAVLDAIAPVSPEVEVRIALERGRLLRSAGSSAEATPFFEAAAAQAEATGLEALQVDALHMVALVLPAEQQLAANERALELARACTDVTAQNWDASLLNNIGMVHADAGRWPEALSAFEDALAARERIGVAERTQVAWWMVAWALRNLGRRDEARAIQLRLKAEHDAAGTSDPYVDEELTLLG
jgi:tetratricopeptide (TPR) repeat protein